MLQLNMKIILIRYYDQIGGSFIDVSHDIDALKTITFFFMVQQSKNTREVLLNKKRHQLKIFTPDGALFENRDHIHFTGKSANFYHSIFSFGTDKYA